MVLNPYVSLGLFLGFLLCPLVCLFNKALAACFKLFNFYHYVKGVIKRFWVSVRDALDIWQKELALWRLNP